MPLDWNGDQAAVCIGAPRRVGEPTPTNGSTHSAVLNPSAPYKLRRRHPPPHHVTIRARGHGGAYTGSVCRGHPLGSAPRDRVSARLAGTDGRRRTDRRTRTVATSRLRRLCSGARQASVRATQGVRSPSTSDGWYRPPRTGYGGTGRHSGAGMHLERDSDTGALAGRRPVYEV